MNIKSEFLNKAVPWFPNFSFAMLLFSVVVAGFLTLLIIAFGEGIYFKLLSIIIGMVVLLVWTYDKSVTDTEDRDKVLKQGLTIFVLTVILIEIPLFFNAQIKGETGVTVIVTQEHKNGARIPDGDNNSDNDKYEQIPYKLITFYNSDTNHELGYRKIYEGKEENMKLYTNIVGKTNYIDYFPFFTYSEEFKYIRDNNDTN